MANQKTANYYRAGAIRRRHRDGLTVPQLAAAYGESESTIRKVLNTRTNEGASKILNDTNTPRVVKRYMHIEGRLVDLTNLIQTRTE